MLETECRAANSHRIPEHTRRRTLNLLGHQFPHAESGLGRSFQEIWGAELTKHLWAQIYAQTHFPRKPELTEDQKHFTC